MNSFLNYRTFALAELAVSGLLAVAAASPVRLKVSGLGPSLTSPSTPGKAPAARGFIPRWLLLEPIGVNGLTDSAVQTMV